MKINDKNALDVLKKEFSDLGPELLTTSDANINNMLMKQLKMNFFVESTEQFVQ